MTDEEFKKATTKAYIDYVREMDGLPEDTPVGTPVKFILDVKVHMVNGLTPQETAERIYKDHT